MLAIDSIAIYTAIIDASSFLFKLNGNMAFFGNNAEYLIRFESSTCYNTTYCYGAFIAGNILMNNSINYL